jgi:hypothetical protein
VVGLFGPPYRVEYEPVRHLLLVEEDERLAVLDLLGGDGDELLARTDPAREQLVGGRRIRRDPAAQKVQQSAPAGRGEQLPVDVGGQVVERVDVRLPGVVQVGHTGYGIGGVLQPADEVDEELAVAANLRDRVQHHPAGGTCGHAEFRVAVDNAGARPLFELHDDVGNRLTDRMPTGQYYVSAQTRQRELVLDEHLDIAEIGVDQVLREDRKTRRPRLLLAAPRLVTVRK